MKSMLTTADEMFDTSSERPFDALFLMVLKSGSGLTKYSFPFLLIEKYRSGMIPPIAWLMAVAPAAPGIPHLKRAQKR